MRLLPEPRGPRSLSRDQAQLARVGGGNFRRGRALQIVELGIEAADQLVQLDGSLPDLEEKIAALAGADDSALAVDGWIVTLVPGAAAVEFARSDLQTFSISF
jgi:hypothetical protein